jgi:carbon storage regulator
LLYISEPDDYGAEGVNKSLKETVMLHLTRKVGESVIINGRISVRIEEIRGKTVRLGVTSGREDSVLRQEVYERIQAENQAASSGAGLFARLFGGKEQP